MSTESVSQARAGALADAEHLRTLVEQGRAASLTDAPTITTQRAEHLVDDVRGARRAR
jgi:hypothetical protein